MTEAIVSERIAGRETRNKVEMQVRDYRVICHLALAISRFSQARSFDKSRTTNDK
jgi:hypothetical protein